MALRDKTMDLGASSIGLAVKDIRGNYEVKPRKSLVRLGFVSKSISDVH